MTEKWQSDSKSVTLAAVAKPAGAELARAGITA